MEPALLLGIAAGFALAIPPGPIAVAVTRHGLEGNPSSGLKVALGAALMDSVYALIAAFASSALIVALANTLSANGWIAVVFQIVCVILLLFLGIRYLRHKFGAVDERTIEEKEQAQEDRARKLGYSSPFFLGVLIAVTNLALPTFIPSLIGVVGYFDTRGWLSDSVGDRFFYGAGFGLGTLIWFAVVLRLLSRLRKKFSNHILAALYRFAGGVFLVSALVLAVNVAVTTEWSSLFPS